MKVNQACPIFTFRANDRKKLDHIEHLLLYSHTQISKETINYMEFHKISRDPNRLKRRELLSPELCIF